MDSKDRLQRDGDKMFIPINIDGGFNDSFNVFSSGRLYCLLGVVIGYIAIMFLMVASYISIGLQLVVTVLYWLLGLWLIRKFVINEKYYYKIISKMQEYERTTPAVFWGISDIIGDNKGALLQYTDGKVGVIVRLNKNIITGKNASARDMHYNSMSDFYNDLVGKQYKFVQFNKMETLGKDTRLQELDKLVYKVENSNLRKLMELQVKYLKVNARETLYETDYILVYTDKVLKRDSILDDVLDSLEILVQGSNYSTYTVLDKVGVVDLVNMEYGTKRFDYLDATMSVFRNGNNRGLRKEPIIITDVELGNGDKISLSELEVKKLKLAVQEYKVSDTKVYRELLDILGRDIVECRDSSGDAVVEGDIEVDDGIFDDAYAIGVTESNLDDDYIELE